MTALQELRWFVSDGLNDYDESIKISEIWSKINELIPKEKQQILDAFNQGYREGEMVRSDNSTDISEFADADIYFNHHFNNENRKK